MTERRRDPRNRPQTNVGETSVLFSMEDARMRLSASFRVVQQKDHSLKDGLLGQFNDGSCVVYSNDEEVCRKLAEIFKVERL